MTNTTQATDEIEITLTDGHEVFERRYIDADRKHETLRELNAEAYKATAGNVYWTL